jgi:glutaminyl-tRNA synthetase
LQTPEEIKLNRGNFVEPGKNSPYRDATVEENLRVLKKCVMVKFRR